MTASSAGSSSSMSAKGLDISLAALQRQDPYIKNIVDVASQVALYTFNSRANEWEKTEVEGTLFVYTRLASPRHGFTIMNRLRMENLTEPITKDLDFQLQHPFLLYRNARFVIHGIWFYDKEDCQRIAQRMKILTQQEQALAQSQVRRSSPERGGSATKTVDIIKMLTNAQTDYEKAQPTPEPKEIGGSNVLCRNPNVIKPIPVKPNAQDSDYAKPRGLSLATLFGFQMDHQSSKPDPVSPLVTPLEASSPGLARPPVARTLTYEDALNSNSSEILTGGNVAAAGSPGKGQAVGAGAQTLREVGGNVVVGLPGSGSARHQRDQEEPQQPCPAFQKLMQGQRGVSGGVGVLQTVSESPENRLCDNGVPVEHHHQPHFLPHHHHHHQKTQQQTLDPLQRLFQTQPVFPSSSSLNLAAPPCCSLQQNFASGPIRVTSVPCSHLRAQHHHQSCFEPSKPQPESLHNQSAPSIQGWASQVPGVVSPHELLRKLQLVQHEQRETAEDPARPCPGLAPRFLGPTQALAECPAPDLSATAAIKKAAMQIPVMSPQTIAATVTPNLLLSPNVFTQANTCAESAGVATEHSLLFSKLPLQPEVPVLSRNQLQATLLTLIKSDSSFLDTIYEAYISRFANSTSSKY